jgi:hypothetical protein
MFFGFAKQTEKQSKQIEFRFVSVRTEKKFDCFEDTLKRHGLMCVNYYSKMRLLLHVLYTNTKKVKK